MDKKNKALFLDRDGVIINERGDYNYLPKHAIINETIVPLLKEAQEHNYLLIVITNQGGISKGLYTNKEVEKIHKIIEQKLGEVSIVIHEFFYCPHHDSIEKCICRKPNSQLLEKAISIYNIDPIQSFMIGDKETDVQAAQKLGIKGIRIQPNSTINGFHFHK